MPRGVAPGINEPTLSESDERAIVAAVEQQLGLKLEPRKASMEVLVIDHVERPVETHAQRPTAAAAIPAFQLVSLKANKSGDESSNMNVSLLPGDVSAPTGGSTSPRPPSTVLSAATATALALLETLRLDPMIEGAGVLLGGRAAARPLRIV